MSPSHRSAELNRVADLLNEHLVDMTATAAKSTVLASMDEPTASSASRGGSASGSSASSATTTPPLWRRCSPTGCSTSWEAPEFAQSDKLRQVFRALENRAYLGVLCRQRRWLQPVRMLIGAENQRAEMHDVSLSSHPMAGLAVRSGSSGCWARRA